MPRVERIFTTKEARFSIFSGGIFEPRTYGFGNRCNQVQVEPHDYGVNVRYPLDAATSVQGGISLSRTIVTPSEGEWRGRQCIEWMVPPRQFLLVEPLTTDHTTNGESLLIEA